MEENVAQPPLVRYRERERPAACGNISEDLLTDDFPSAVQEGNGCAEWAAILAGAR